MKLLPIFHLNPRLTSEIFLADMFDTIIEASPNIFYLHWQFFTDTKIVELEKLLWYSILLASCMLAITASFSSSTYCNRSRMRWLDEGTDSLGEISGPLTKLSAISFLMYDALVSLAKIWFDLLKCTTLLISIIRFSFIILILIILSW